MSQFYFQQVIQEAYERYQAETPNRGSLRGFARIIGINSGNLLHLLRGQRGFRQENAHKIAERLGLSPVDKGRFLDSLADFKGRKMKTNTSQEIFVLAVSSARIDDAIAILREAEMKLAEFVENDETVERRWFSVQLFSDRPHA